MLTYDVNPGGKQKHLRSTPFHSTNPCPNLDILTHRHAQDMVYPDNHPIPWTTRPPKGWKAVFTGARVSVGWICWQTQRQGGGENARNAQSHRQRRMRRDGLRPREAMGQEDTLEEADLAQVAEPDTVVRDDWCCNAPRSLIAGWFRNEKPMLQHYLEGRGHVCLSCPSFIASSTRSRCWGYAKYCKSFSYAKPFIFTDSLTSQVIALHLTANSQLQNGLSPVSQYVWHCHDTAILSKDVALYGCILVSTSVYVVTVFAFAH